MLVMWLGICFSFFLSYRNAVEVKYNGELPDDMYWKDDGTVGYKEEEDDESEE